MQELFVVLKPPQKTFFNSVFIMATLTIDKRKILTLSRRNLISKKINTNKIKDQQCQQRLPCVIAWNCLAYRDITSVNVVRLWVTFYLLQRNTRMVIYWEKEPFIDIGNCYSFTIRDCGPRDPPTAFYYTTAVKALLCSYPSLWAFTGHLYHNPKGLLKKKTCPIGAQ